MSSVPSCDLIVLVGRRETVSRIADVLADWSAAGLVAPVHVVDVDAVRFGEHPVPALVVEGGRVRVVALEQELATRERTDRVRVCALTELTSVEHALDPQHALAMVEVVSGALPNLEASRIHLVGMTSRPTTPTRDLGWLGWHNVVIAPENSQSPAAGVAPLIEAPGDAVRINHFGAAVCSLTGAWLAEPRGPLDDRPVPPARSLVAARTFTRHLSASAVGSELLVRLTSVEDGYPVPLIEGASAWVIEDEVTAVEEMADSLLAKHPYVLPRPRTQPQPRSPRKIGPLEALRMLFAFLWGALRNAPKAFLDAMVRKVSVATAAAVNAAAFGGQSEFVVVVNGYKPDGTPVSWDELDDALETMGARLGSGQQMAGIDLTELWRDFVSGGLTLLDAEKRVPDLPPRMRGSQRGIITTPGRVAPEPLDVYRPPENVAAWIVDRDVASFDPIAARTLATQLDELASAQPHVAGPARNARTDLLNWFEPRRRSYTGRIGWRFSDGMVGLRAEISQLVGQLRQAQEASVVPSRIEEAQRSLAHKLWGVLAIALFVAAALVLCAVLNIIGLVILLVGLVLTGVGWVVFSVMVFLRGQQELFRMLHEREQLATRLAVLRQHLAEAVEDMQRLHRAYRQYYDWCRAFGRFVQHPLGRPQLQSDDEILPGAGFPLNHRFGAARPQQAVLDEAAARTSRDLFGVGWLSDAWSSFLADVPQAMGPQSFRVRENTDLLFTDPGVARHSLLSGWAAAVVQRHDWPGATAALRVTLATLLGGPAQDLASRLLASVECRDQAGELQTLTYEAFVNGLDRPETSTAGYQAFARSLFSESTVGGEAWVVKESPVRQSTSDLGRTIVLTQISGGFNSYDLAVTAVVGPSAPRATPSLDDPYRPNL